MARKQLVNPENDTMNLLEKLDNLPLAITQAAAYLDVNGVSTSEYLRLLSNTEQDMIEILSAEMRDRTRYKQTSNAVATTWIISFRQITKSDAVAADLLYFMSCIEWEAIPYSILPKVLPEARLISAMGNPLFI